MSQIDFVDLMEYCKAFCGLSSENEAILKEVADDMIPHLQLVTDSFYENIQNLEKARPFLEGRLELLKKTHFQWLVGIFKDDYDEEYTRKIYHVGDKHVKVKLPVEFMSGAMTQIQLALTPILMELYKDDPSKCLKVINATNASFGFNLLIMQASYQSSSMSAELERFLNITGMSRILFENLARAYKE